VKWECSKAGIIDDSTSVTALVTMPGEPVTITAILDTAVGILKIAPRSNAPVVLLGTQLYINHQVQLGVLRVIGFNGRIVTEQFVGAGQMINLESLHLSSGAYLLQVTGRSFKSPTMRFVVK